MNPTFCALLLSLAAAGADPAPAGRYLVLDTDQVIEGQVERVGDRYRVVKDGGETELPAARVVAVCPDLPGAYRALANRVAKSDGAARLRLARWCESVRLREQAVAEATTAVALLPRSADAQRYLAYLKSSPPLSAATTAAPPAAPPPAAEVHGVSADVLRRFTGRAQPVLMNACGTCHAGGEGGGFRLERIHLGAAVTPRETHANVVAVMKQIDPAKPSASKLLTMAVTAHGGAATPPLRDRTVAAYRHLEEWVAVVATAPKPKTAPSPEAVEVTASKSSSSSAEPAAKVGTDGDPFDPEEFNRKHHPGRGKVDAPPTKP